MSQIVSWKLVLFCVCDVLFSHYVLFVKEQGKKKKTNKVHKSLFFFFNQYFFHGRREKEFWYINFALRLKTT